MRVRYRRGLLALPYWITVRERKILTKLNGVRDFSRLFIISHRCNFDSVEVALYEGVETNIQSPCTRTQFNQEMRDGVALYQVLHTGHKRETV